MKNNAKKKKFQSHHNNRYAHMYCLLLILPLIVGCQYIPEMAKDIESVATDTAIKVEISRETFQKDTDLEITINVQNKDEQITKNAPASVANK